MDSYFDATCSKRFRQGCESLKMKIKEKGKWKDVPIDGRFFNEKSFAGFGSIKVLTNYELVKPGQERKSAKPSEESAVQKKSATKVKKTGVTKSKTTGKPKENETADLAWKVTPSPLKKGTPQKGKATQGKGGDGTNEPGTESTLANESNVTKKKRKRKRKKKKPAQKNATDNEGDPDADPKDAQDKAVPIKAGQKRKQKGETDHEPEAKKQKGKKKGKGEKPQNGGGNSMAKNTPSEKAKKKPDLDMSRWKDLFVPPVVLEALEDAGFDSPTPIQCLCLPPAIRDMQDILGAAETGSGKTLAFGIPMIHNILKYRETHQDGASDSELDESEDEFEDDIAASVEDSEDEGPSGEDAREESEEDDEDEDRYEEREVELVEVDSEDEGINEDELEEVVSDEQDLEPEEELFELADDELGCVTAINNVKFDWLDEETDSSEADMFAKRVKSDANKPLLGLVLTPTRELAIQVRNHLQMVCTHTDIKVCAIVGGMAPQKQERLLRKCPEIVVATPGRFWELLEEGNPHLAKVVKVKTLVLDEADRMVEKGHFQEVKQFLEYMNMNSTTRRQTFVYSATLTLIHETPNRLKNKKKVQKMTTDKKLGDLMEFIGLDKKAKIIDLTRKMGTAETLVESKINCTKEEKDIYLQYFLSQYPGRTLVFNNSKDCLRRLVSILNILGTNPLPLHADMHQRQRLKNLDRFRDDPKGLLIATDVAARGLDIPNVQHVIHYQVPRTSENYVHRSGRTARAAKEGLSVMLVGPDDLNYYRRIVKTLNRDEDLGSFPVEPEIMAAVKQRVSLARKIDKAEHSYTKQRKENLWFQKAAEEMDIELDEKELLNDLGDSHEQAVAKQRVAALRRDLKFLLSQPIVPKRFSGKYPTKSGKMEGLYQETGGDACAAAKKEASKTSRLKIPKLKIKRLKKPKGKLGKGKNKK